ncbi:5078_t:CDS:10 [Acaulospora morrowiae]|uniref:5078_t:CDS:1 n=1 Tax=Acaulospora morrowiae TaxID=94023 RepID=A0A9N8ZWC7_9GLOM|nr:5078_t:CDS:10 [Acaulospora morrowiae]
MASQLGFASRPKEPARAGTPFQIVANFLEIAKFNYPTVNSYSLDIRGRDRNSSVSKKDYDMIFLQILREGKLGRGVGAAYDGNLVYSITELTRAGNKREINVVFTPEGDVGRPKNLIATLKYSRQFDLGGIAEYVRVNSNKSWSSEIQTILIVLNAFINSKVRAQFSSSAKKAIFIHRSQNERVFLNGGIELKKGYWQTIRPGWGKLFINIDLCATTYYPSGKLIDIIPHIIAKSRDELRQGLTPEEIEHLSEFLKDLDVTTTYRGDRGRRKHKVFQVSARSADQCTFVAGDGRRISVAEYYRGLGMPLEFRNLPCIVVRKPHKDDVLLPLEVCELLQGQKYKKRLSPYQLQEMIGKVTVRPDDRFRYLDYALKNIYKHQSDENISSIGMEVGSEFVKLMARNLAPPRLIDRERKPIQPVMGNWEVKRFITGINIYNWSVVVFEDMKTLPIEILKNALIQLMELLTQKGLNIVNNKPPIYYANPNGDYSKSLQIGFNNARINRGKAPQLIICVIRKKLKGDSGIRPIIKKTCGTILGVISQCIVASNIGSEKWRQICGNLALKINGRLGGTNSTLYNHELKFKTTTTPMVLGADVFHPGIEEKRKGQPSVAAVCASMDPELTRYVARYGMNKILNNETIEDIENMMKDLLEQFRRRNDGALPEQIIFYRDGVSEGQFQTVLDVEIFAIKNVFKEVYKYHDPPKLTFLIVQKRHHARFLPVNEKDRDPNGGNCKPGTVIDTGIVVPQNFTFFLQSHASPLGTARSAYYHVILNEGNFSADEIQGITYRLCFLSVRCNMALSHVTPVHYAHHIANQARYFVDYDPIPVSARGGRGGRGGRGRGGRGSRGGRDRHAEEPATEKVMVRNGSCARVKDSILNEMYFV